ncbi:site-2 protease family protein [Candidatus Peregrinibacteria bacterium]|nr:MAG: site-2 protease family protein [Candidatus Peregrinibacteria bacterium]
MLFSGLIAFIVIFSVLVLVHEWGHFTMARRAGIRVEEFGLGLPPRAKKLYKDKKGTIYSLNWIPFGGYVRLFGEDAHDPKVLDHKESFASKSKWQRTKVVVGGVAMNFILAWVIITIGFSIGMKPFLLPAELEQKIVEGVLTPVFEVKAIEPESPLSKSEIQIGDQITKINGERVSAEMDVASVVAKQTPTELEYLSQGQEMLTQIQADSSGRLGMEMTLGLVIPDVKYPFYQAPFEAAKEVARLSWETLRMMGTVVHDLITKFSVPDGVAGPVGIFKITQAYTAEGLMALMQLTALLSISLGVINIMPFPALDGGRLLFIVIETIFRKRVKAQWEAITHMVGFALLMALILGITWNDIAKLLA